MGNDSLIYLLDNYKKAYDFYMSVPEVDCANYENLRSTFDEKPTKFVYYVYDKETNEVIGVGKLYQRKKNWTAKKYDDGSATASENANKEESADAPATERTEIVVFPEAAESPSGEADANKASALPIALVAAGGAVLAILLAAILLAVMKRKGSKD